MGERVCRHPVTPSRSLSSHFLSIRPIRIPQIKQQVERKEQEEKLKSQLRHAGRWPTSEAPR